MQCATLHSDKDVAHEVDAIDLDDVVHAAKIEWTDWSRLYSSRWKGRDRDG